MPPHDSSRGNGRRPAAEASAEGNDAVRRWGGDSRPFCRFDAALPARMSSKWHAGNPSFSSRRCQASLNGPMPSEAKPDRRRTGRFSVARSPLPRSMSAACRSVNANPSLRKAGTSAAFHSSSQCQRMQNVGISTRSVGLIGVPYVAFKTPPDPWSSYPGRCLRPRAVANLGQRLHGAYRSPRHP